LELNCETEIDKEKEIFKEQMKSSGKPENIIDKIVEGKIKKFYSEVCLLEQNYIREPKIVIKDMIKEKITILGENISVAKFVRYQIGE
jgi:elongation factor Ts